jgi:hypothetical protein
MHSSNANAQILRFAQDDNRKTVETYQEEALKSVAPRNKP